MRRSFDLVDVDTRPRPAYDAAKQETMDWNSVQFPAIPVRAHTFTPIYLTDDFQPPQQEATTSQSMNDWMSMQGRVTGSQKPVMYAGAQGFKEVPTIEGSDEPLQGTSLGRMANDYNEQFKRSYSDLSQQIAYRYPNPGMPRVRQGAMGGTWRHIKEVLGHHGGSRICFVDGLVAVYDAEGYSEALAPQMKRRTTAQFAPTQVEFAQSKKGSFLPPVETDVARKLRLNSSQAHRGHYSYGN